MKKAEVMNLIDAKLQGEEFQKPVILYDKKMRYPCTGDDANSCPLLGFMLEIEYRTGTLIFVPDAENIANTGDRNKNEVKGEGNQ